MYFGSMSSRYKRASGYIRFRTEYYYPWFCAKKLYKNLKWTNDYHTKEKNRVIKKEFRSGYILDRPHSYRCKLECTSHFWTGTKYVCLEGKSVNADWVEKNL